MKKNDFTYKTIQLILFITLTAICLYIILFDPRMSLLAASDASVRMLCAFLWLILGLSFLFIYRDLTFFSSYKKDFRELDYAVHSDPVSGLANRFSCDAMIDRYLDRALPPDLGCVMFDLTNIGEINRLYGHIQGNRLIKEFSEILKNAASDLCFVGRNGGNKFLAVFEDGTQKDINTFLERVHQKVQSFNSSAARQPIEYRYGIAFHEGNEMLLITDLIAISNKRIYQ